MPNNPRKLAKAARLYVIPCDLQPDRWHVAGGEGPHVVLRSQRNPLHFICDCRGSRFHCSHVICVQWFLDRITAPSARKEAVCQ